MVLCRASQYKYTRNRVFVKNRFLIYLGQRGQQFV